MRLLFFGGLTAAVAVANAAVARLPHAHVLHEKREYTPKSWMKRSRVNSEALLPMRIGMAQRNLDIGPGLLMEVSDHESPRYGQHYTAEEVNEIFAPAPEAVETVVEWLEDAGIEPDRISQSINKQWIQFDASVEEVETLLRTEYHLYEHEPSGKMNIACEGYHIPKHVQGHVDYITPGIKLFVDPASTSSRTRKESGEGKSLEKRHKSLIKGGPGKPIMHPVPGSVLQKLSGILEPLELQLCGEVIFPVCIRKLYNVSAPTTSVPGNELGIFESIGDTYAQEDLDLFFQLLTDIPAGTHPILQSVDGATAPDPVAEAGPESDLDFEIAYPLIYPQGTKLYQTDDDVYQAEEANGTSPFFGFFNTFLDAIDGSYCTYSADGETGNDPKGDPVYPDPQPGGFKGNLECGIYKPTNVISISYGGQEFDLPAYYQKRQCNEFMKLGLQGVSIVIASGDSGVAGPKGDDNPDGCLGPGGKIFSPDFPATCPYLTVAGATVLPMGGDVNKDEETAVTRFPSGGGFSNIYPIPDYQKAAVANYFAKHDPGYPYYSSVNNNSFGANGGIYNRLGRGYPDVSAIGDNIIIFNKGAPTLIGGTSASTPVFAALLTRINEVRLANGKKPVGFVNPVLYKNTQAFHDITKGNNSGCGTSGFFAVQGWDPVTGLGTPNYPVLLDVFTSLP